MFVNMRYSMSYHNDIYIDITLPKISGDTGNANGLLLPVQIEIEC